MDRHAPPQSPPAAGAPEAAGAALAEPDGAAAPEELAEAVALAEPDGAAVTAAVVAGGAEFEAPEEEHAERPIAAQIQTRRRTRRTLHKDPALSLFFVGDVARTGDAERTPP